MSAAPFLQSYAAIMWVRVGFQLLLLAPCCYLLLDVLSPLTLRKCCILFVLVHSSCRLL